MKIIIQKYLITLAISCRLMEAVSQVDPSSKYNDKEWDVVIITDDVHFNKGLREDMPLTNSLKRLGRKAIRVSIQNKTFDFNSSKAIVIRSAWGKYEYLEHYRKFIDEIDYNPTIALFNPGAMFRWHGKKSVYLRHLAENGINMPQSVWVYANNTKLPKLEDIAQELGDCGEMVIKPASGNAGRGIKLVMPWNMEAMQDHLFYLVRGFWPENGWVVENEEMGASWDFTRHEDADDVMIQCFQEQIATKCERGVIFIGGQVTHGVRKCPRRGEFKVHEARGGTTEVYQPTKEEINFATKVAGTISAIIGESVAYLRVDLFNDNNDKLALMEVAAGTAQMWLAQYPQAADVFATYIDDYLHLREKAGISFGTKNKDIPGGVTARPMVNFINRRLEETIDTVQTGTKVLVWWPDDRKYVEGEITMIKHCENCHDVAELQWHIKYNGTKEAWCNPLREHLYIPITKFHLPGEGSVSNTRIANPFGIGEVLEREKYILLGDSINTIQSGSFLWVWWSEDKKYHKGHIIYVNHQVKHYGNRWYWYIDYGDGNKEWIDPSKSKVVLQTSRDPNPYWTVTITGNST